MPASPPERPQASEAHPHPLLDEVRTMLGLPPDRSLMDLAIDELHRLTHKQLLLTSQKLGLSGASTLSKGTLADKLLGAIRHVGAGIAERAADAGAELLRGRKFGLRADEDRGPAVHESPTIPWSYGHDRVTAMPVDPDRLYCYWEVTDHAIARARHKLGAGGEGAWLNLRVYDTTGRLFDGTNAHAYFDHAVERHDRQWFFAIGRPTSQAVVEVGLLSREGFFVKVARSGRVDFPARAAAPESEPEWLTVTLGGDVHASGRGNPVRGRGGWHPGQGGGDHVAASGGGGDAQVGPTAWNTWTFPWDDFMRSGEVVWEERFEWETFFATGFFEGFRSWTWEEGPHTITTWEAGPFTYPVEVPAPRFESFTGKVRSFQWPGGSRVVYGPWEVVIRGLGGRTAKRTLARWQLHRSWLVGRWRAAHGEVRTSGTPGAGSSGRLVAGSSERVGMGGSEERLGGASEVWYVGASERRLGGSSEQLFAGASERLTRGSSEHRLAAASEYRLGGSSEERLGGASELAYRGASEGRLGGSSERMGHARAAGGSEGRLGGGSEGRLAGGDAPEGFPHAATPPATGPYPRAPGKGER